jgi:hypothetical protein
MHLVARFIAVVAEAPTLMTIFALGGRPSSQRARPPSVIVPAPVLAPALYLARCPAHGTAVEARAPSDATQMSGRANLTVRAIQAQVGGAVTKKKIETALPTRIARAAGAEGRVVCPQTRVMAMDRDPASPFSGANAPTAHPAGTCMMKETHGPRQPASVSVSAPHQCHTLTSASTRSSHARWIYSPSC